MLQICWSPGLRPGPRWGTLQRSPRPASWWGGGSLPPPQKLTPAFGPPGLKLWPYTGLRLRPYGPRPTVPPHFKPWIRPWGPQVTFEPGPLRALLRHCFEYTPNVAFPCRYCYWISVRPTYCVCVFNIVSRLPMSHTCFNQLVLPAYRSRKLLRQKLMIALQNAEGFGLE